ncbi:MAG: Tex family protein [Desulfofustis sp.]|jgi:uncharacterized protein|nr:Tex family protein [Desulfofustis sp.]
MTVPAPHHLTIAAGLGITGPQVAAAAELFDGGATVPFIARYRKEVTGCLDEVALTTIKDQLNRHHELVKRRAAVISSLQERQLLTEQLAADLNKATTLTELEDIYLPFRPKRRTRAAIARERGLEPLAKLLLEQGQKELVLTRFINPEQQVPDAATALAGARDIIAERVTEDPATRSTMREFFRRRASVVSRVVEKNREAAAKYRDYFQWQEPITRIAGHRLLALLRGETEKMLSVSIRPDEQAALAELTRRWLKPSPHRDQVLAAIEDGYKRLLAPSLENEIRQELKDKADREAITVFADNLRHLLLAPPLGQKRVMALDPGFRTGAKLVCLDGQGRLLHTTTIYPTQGEKQRSAAAQTVRELADTYRIETIAVGSGTAGRETEAFIREVGLDQRIMITMVNEDGASIYSASEIARREFPDLDLTVRGAVSIGRRLQDPLAELVKIDPKSIGVGQYQHDVNQALLKASLAEVVASCVNSVGVEVNSASGELLTHVSGIGEALAAAIVHYRDQHGPFRSRRELLKVPRLGAKAFEQAAGFLRISGGSHPLDASAVHPERYGLVEQMAADLGATVADVLASPSLRESIEVSAYCSESIGLPTLTDIMEELARPGRDPRQQFQSFRFAEGINEPADLQPGMIVPAIITNVTTFGAFADIGVHRDGLIHISQLADTFVSDPAAVVRVRQQVQVRILEVDLDRQRISLSMKGLA